MRFSRSDKTNRRSSSSPAAGRRQQDNAVSYDNQTTRSTSQNSFRRNRTLTGSTSKSVASSGELNAELASPRAHAHTLTKTRRKLGFLLAALLLAATAVYILLTQLVAEVQVSVVGATQLTLNPSAKLSANR